MAIELEFFTLTGTVSSISDGFLSLKYWPTTGPNGEWDIGVDPIHGPSQYLDRGPLKNSQDPDFGVTGTFGVTGGAQITYNLENSDIKKVRQELLVAGETGPILRVLYNY